MWRRVVIVLVGCSLTACAAATTSSSASYLRSAGRDAITAAEIVASRVTDVYQAVAHLRPEFLRRRSQRTATALSPSAGIAIYLDDLPFGSEESLRFIPLERVRLIQYLSQADADIRYGRSHPAGAILVTTLKK
jgi:hypothetical protein